MKIVSQFYGSTLGKKVVVAVTGAAMLLFVIGHVAGNLKAFGGYDADGIHKLDHYAEFLRTAGEEMLGRAGLLWAARIGLLVALILHIVTVVQLRIRNSQARPVGYRKKSSPLRTTAASTMFWGGIVLAVFIAFHICHLTLGIVGQQFEEGQVYYNVYTAFQNPLILAGYTIAMVVLGLHLWHGIWSLFQTLGLDNPDRNFALRSLASVLSVLIVVGFLSVPFACYFEVISAPRNL